MNGAVGRQLVQAVRRVVDALLPPAPRPNIPAPPVPAPAPEEEVQRRARQALAAARAHLEPLLSDGPRLAEEAVEHPLAESVLLRQSLRAYTDHVERLLAAAEEERRALRAQINRLTEEVLVLRAEVAELRATLPAAVGLSGSLARPSVEPPAAANHATGSTEAEATKVASGQGGPGPAAVDAPPHERIIPAGSVGIVVELHPRQQSRHLEALCARLLGNPAVERAEPLVVGEDAARLRLAFRQPVTWEQLKDAFAQAAGAQVEAALAGPPDHVLHLRLRAPVPAPPHPALPGPRSP